MTRSFSSVRGDSRSNVAASSRGEIACLGASDRLVAHWRILGCFCHARAKTWRLQRVSSGTFMRGREIRHLSARLPPKRG